MKKMRWGFVLFGVSMLLFYFCFGLTAADPVVQMVMYDPEDLMAQFNRIERYQRYFELLELLEQYDQEVQECLTLMDRLLAEMTPGVQNAPQISPDLNWVTASGSEDSLADWMRENMPAPQANADEPLWNSEDEVDWEYSMSEAPTSSP